MTDYEVRIGGERRNPAAGWTLVWDDRAQGIARLVSGTASVPVVVEGNRSDWVVTLNGRRISVSVLTRRERLLADAASVERTHAGPTIVKATLPGLIVTVTVEVGDEVAEGATLLTIEAMKMQNEVRAPRAGKVIEVTVAAGQVVATGAALLRLE